MRQKYGGLANPMLASSSKSFAGEFMNLRNSAFSSLALGAIMVGAMAPGSAMAQTSHRQETKNTWRNAAIGAGILGLYGLNKGDSTLALVGAAGALYSANRYEQDRKSQSKQQRARAAIFRRGYYYSHGHKYVKKTVYKDGHKYYQFVRVS